MSINKTETQAYKLIREEENFEIRYYPAATMASITSTARSYKQLGSSGFRKLAGYIFGGNEGSHKISMTTPVRMNISDSISTMSFVMPATYDSHNLPKPNDEQVTIKTMPDEYVAAIRFSGYASDEDVKINTEKLKKLLAENKINFYGNFVLLAYNAPYQIINRRNEIIVKVNWDESK